MNQLCNRRKKLKSVCCCSFIYVNYSAFILFNYSTFKVLSSVLCFCSHCVLVPSDVDTKHNHSECFGFNIKFQLPAIVSCIDKDAVAPAWDGSVKEREPFFNTND